MILLQNFSCICTFPLVSSGTSFFFFWEKSPDQPCLSCLFLTNHASIVCPWPNMPELSDPDKRCLNCLPLIKHASFVWPWPNMPHLSDPDQTCLSCLPLTTHAALVCPWSHSAMLSSIPLFEIFFFSFPYDDKKETFHKLLDIYQSLRGVPVDFISPTREFVTQGPVIKIAARSGERQLRQIFLVSYTSFPCKVSLLLFSCFSVSYFTIR